MPETVCQYHNCQETDTPILVTIKGDPGERVRFCTLAHLALWSRKRFLRNPYSIGVSLTPDERFELGLIDK